CVIGLVVWEWWVAKQTPRPRPPTSAQLSPAPTPLAGTSPSAVPLTASSPPSAATGTPAPEATPAFAEKIETLRNDDVEFRLTNRGGGIREAVLLNHIGQGGDRLVINSKDQSYYTRLVWCVDGKAKGVDVGWFGGGGGVFGIGQRAPQPFYQQDLANADWAAVSDQFFTTLIAPLTAKGNGVWGRRFDISP